MATFVNGVACGPGESMTISGAAIGPGARTVNAADERSPRPLGEVEYDDEARAWWNGELDDREETGQQGIVNTGVLNVGKGTITITDSTVGGRHIDHLEMNGPGEIR